MTRPPVLCIWSPGTRVFVGEMSKIKALVTAVSITSREKIIYEVAWWHEGVRHAAWVQPEELRARAPRTAIGFRRA